MDDLTAPDTRLHTVSVVIPVYQGESTLESIVNEILAIPTSAVTPAGTRFSVTEIVLVDDNGPDRSDLVMRRLGAAEERVRPIWLSRNFGQHAATLAGMASSSGDWVVTIDEDGQQDPADIGRLLDTALHTGAQVVYAKPTNEPPHGALRNAASRSAKRFAESVFGTGDSRVYNSFRLVLGSVARGVAAYTGSGVYLDVALGWVAGRFAQSPVELRGELRPSGYTFRRLLSHFWRLALTSGTRALRLVSIIGAIFALGGIVLALVLVIVKLTAGIDIQGWTSTVVILLVVAGVILFSLGVIAEYIGISVNMAMGKPSYFIISDPASGPLGDRARVRQDPNENGGR